MSIVKQSLPINFSQGLDTKTDPWQVEPGKFLALQNTVFNKGGLLQKRNGYATLASLPNTSSTYLTTFNGNLTALGSSSIQAYNSGSTAWVSKGSITPLKVSTLPLIRNSINQIQCDTAVSSNNLVCTVYTENNAGTLAYKYAVADATTGQNIIAPTAITPSAGTITGSPRVFQLGTYFMIVFTPIITGVKHIQYIAVSTTNPTVVTAAADIISSYTSATTVSWDGVVVNNKLFLAWNTLTGGQSIKMTYISSTLGIVAPITLAGYKATMMSLCVDNTSTSNPVIYTSFYDATGSTGYTYAVDQSLNIILNPVRIIPSGTILNITSAAQNGSCTVFTEVSNTYSYDSGIASNYINSITITPLGTTFKSVFSSGASTITASSATGLVNGMYVVDNTTSTNIAAGTTFTISGTTLTLSINTAGASASSPGDSLAAATVSSSAVVVRSVGLASKAFIQGGQIYFLAAFSSPYQPSYFLINGSTSTAASPVVVGKIAYSNGGGYLTIGLPSVSVMNNTAMIPYLYKDLIASVNKGTNLATGTQTAGIYSQTGINLGSFNFTTQGINTAEIGSNLNIGGGFMWMYDGYLPVEQNFFLWPDSVECTWSATGGSIAAKPDGSTNTNAYYYQVVYEWADNQGNIFRSAPSVPVAVTTTGAASTGSITINVPNLRLTYKTANPVKLVIYRWSVAQQAYYQVTSVSSATLNSTTADSTAFVDTLADATILGNSLIYTTGGVVEDVNAPATNNMTLFDTRLWMVDAEDKNLLWFSKQVIEATPVEMSDLLTYYIAPTTAAQGSTGPITALSVMDDKLIIFKNNAIYYINGTGPDNTGANSQYSQPIFVTSTVGCTNQNSIVFTPNGLMFQSDKGIWLLGRDMNTSYIGAPVEQYNSQTVLSAVNVPATNQVRITLGNGVVLMYDYFFAQWGTFGGVPAVSACIFQGLHTFINSTGVAYQETPGLYLDGSNPVLMSLTTSWFNMAGLQGYQRAYFFFLLGQYITPHTLTVGIAYDYSPSIVQQDTIIPTNSTGLYGADSPYGQQNIYGNGGTVEQSRVFMAQQRCQSFQLTIQENFDPSQGIAAGAGLTLSGINLIAGFKGKFPTIRAANSVG